ncbi:carbon-nitrogen hydrolase family protein [Aquamicrobium ahrensii]|uniref:Amidohydrolase n=1 Tax=Aquamicrobium ahrensii TaxID=469551 RepID=A0ABV2KPA7_9HYPH
MIAVFQDLPAAGLKSANIIAMERATQAAAAVGSRLIVFPELFLTGYNIGRQALHELAEPVDGPSVEAIADIARRHGIGVIAGMPEKNGGNVFNAAVAVDETGAIAGLYRKIHLFGPAERSAFTPGSEICVVLLAGLRVGLAVCYDIEFPEMARALVGAGAELICAPTANMSPYWEVPTTLLRARALENGVPVAYANLVGDDGELTYTGMSCIVGADGRDLARAGVQGRALLCCSHDYVAAGLGGDQLSTQANDVRLDFLSAGATN